MKILAISTRIPEDGKKGDQVLSFHRLTYLARKHEIMLICFGDINKDYEAVNRLESKGIIIKLIKWSVFAAIANVLAAIINPKIAFQCALFNSTDFKNQFEAANINFEPDAVYAVTIRVYENIVNYKGFLFVDLIDSMALNFSRRIEKASRFKRLLLKIEFDRVQRYEKHVAKRSSRSFVVSSIDLKVIDCANLHAIPLGVDSNQFFKFGHSSENPVVIFTGNMNYKPNVDAVMWFYHNCWDKLKHVIPECQLVIAGSSPTSEVVALTADHSVKVTGRVPSLACLINTARVSIAPMQSGSGMQFKILEAMACGIPVVTTTLGLGDIKAVADRDLLLADLPDEFVDMVISLIINNELHTQISNSGYQFVKTHHTWEAINLEFENQILQALI